MSRMLKLLAGGSLIAAICSGCIYVEEGGGGDYGYPSVGADSCSDHGLSCDPPADEGCGAGCAECDEGVCTDYADTEGGCSADADCFDGELCVGGECLWCPQECDASAECDSGWRCSTDGICLPSDRCRQDEDCRGGQVCAPNGYCSNPIDDSETPVDPPDDGAETPECPDDNCEAPACVHNSDCAAGDYCVDGSCLDSCTADADCGTGEICQADVCDVPLCVPDPDGGDECLYNSECDGGVCQNGYCIDRCSADADCAEGEYCDAGSCRADHRPQPQCRVNSDCATDEVCSDAKCRVYCTCDEDCGGEVGDFVCDAGACLPTAEASPECLGAADCAAGQHCVDGACL